MTQMTPRYVWRATHTTTTRRRAILFLPLDTDFPFFETPPQQRTPKDPTRALSHTHPSHCLSTSISPTMAEIKETSKIPTSCTQTESTVLPCPLPKAWALFRDLALHTIAPQQIAATSWESGTTAAHVGSVLKVTYQDGSVWRLRVTDFSERNHSVAYEVLDVEPAVTTASRQGELTFTAVTSDDTTFFTWTTEFSNDADLAVISDQKYKKLEFFKDVKSNLK